MELPIFQVDAFTDSQFKGNPAAVVILEKNISAELMQEIAFENNLSETAFIDISKTPFEIRWFTPTIEVDLCCLLYTSPSPRDRQKSRMPSSA